MLGFLKALLSRYSDDEVANRAAALSYYTIFSLGPLLFVILGILGLVLDNANYKAHLLDQLQKLIGSNATDLLNGVLSNQGLNHKTGLAFWIGGVGLVLGAIGIFGQLQHALNAILHVEIGPGVGKKQILRQKLVSLGLVGLICFLLIVSLVASTVISLVAGKFNHDKTAGFLFFTLDFAGSLIILSILLSLLYRTLPAIKIAWSVLFKASLLVGLMFTLGKIVLGIIIGNNGSVSAFGAAGSLIALLLWIFYSGQILYLGAAGMSLYLDSHPEKITPRYGGRDGVLRVTTTKQPLQPDLAHRLLDKLIDGWREGWND